MLSSVRTSGLAALPMHSSAALYNFYLNPDHEHGVTTLTNYFDALNKWHTYLHENRLSSDGLVYSIVRPRWRGSLRCNQTSLHLLILLLLLTLPPLKQHPWEGGMEALPSMLELLPPEGPQCNLTAVLPIPANITSRADFPGTEAYRRSLCLAQCSKRHLYQPFATASK